MTIEVDILDVPDREDLVAWLFSEGIQWGEVTQEDKLMLTLYPRKDGDVWVLNLDDVINALAQAKHDLMRFNHNSD